MKKEYKVIRSTSLATVVEEVNIALAAGWETLGGIAVSHDHTHPLFLQALEKAVNEKAN